MFFITGMMGPYMRPMALNVPLAMLSSMLVALAITPWVSSKLLKRAARPRREADDLQATTTYRVYDRLMRPFAGLARQGRRAAARDGRRCSRSPSCWR